MSELSTTQKRDFLQFVTGSPKLPIGGKFIYGDWPSDIWLTRYCRFQELDPNVHRRP